MITIDQSRRLDRDASRFYRIPSLLLMENAGRAVAEAAFVAAGKKPARSECIVVCGGGSNGGDGLVAARHLRQRNWRVRVLLTADPKKYTGDSELNYRIIRSLKIPANKLRGDRASKRRGPTVIIDAILGSGFHGDPRADALAGIRFINARKQWNPAGTKVIAVDIPSGLHGDFGPLGTETVKADHTVTFVDVKPGLLRPNAKPFVGAITIADIGIPKSLVRRTSGRKRKFVNSKPTRTIGDSKGRKKR